MDIGIEWIFGEKHLQPLQSAAAADRSGAMGRRSEGGHQRARGAWVYIILTTKVAKTTTRRSKGDRPDYNENDRRSGGGGED